MFRKSVEKIQVFYNPTRITGTLSKDLSTFMIISHLFHRMRNVAKKL